jgi:hypothetical protein
MDIGTHGLASLALVRAAWPRAPKQIWIAAVVTGTIANVDVLSAWIGPEQYLVWRGACTHALLTSLLLATLSAAAYRFIATADFRNRFSVVAFFWLALAAQWLHLAMDLCGTTGIALLWPFSTRRFAADWIVNVDPWIIAVLLGALLLPELLHLVTDEIGVRDQRPRGRIGASIGFAVIILYLGMRANFHANVLALMDARIFRGEVAKRVGAFPESISPFAWHGIVETERGLHTLTVQAGPVDAFDPESAESLFKPEPSTALDTASKTSAAQQFLQIAQFPKATVEVAPAGTRVELRDLAFAAAGNTTHEVAAIIQLGAANRVASQEIVWVK